MELNLERLRLVVCFDPDCQAAYPLELGAYSIGSNKACTIRLDGGGIEDVHAFLSIEPHGIYIENRSSSMPPSKEGEPLTDRTLLAVGETIILGPYSFRLAELTPPRNTATRDLSPEARGQVEELWSQFRRGLPGYDDVLTKLAPFISPEEAGAARDATATSLKAFSFTLLLLVLTMVGAVSLPANRPNFAAIFYDLSTMVALLGALVLISRFQVHFAGRMIMPLWWLLRFLAPPTSDWHELPHVLVAVRDLLGIFLIGVLVDFGASPGPRREQPLPRPRSGPQGLRRMILILVGAWMVVDAIQDSEKLQGWFLVLSVISSLACMVWGWWPGPALARAFHGNPFDVQVLKLIGIRRWARFAGGRLLAACLGIIPALLLFYSNAVKDNLKWPEKDNQRSAIKTPGPNPKVWFWAQTGRLLTPGDLQTYSFYGFRHADVPGDHLRVISALEDRLNDDPYNRTVYNRLKERLQQYRLIKPETIRSILADTVKNSDQQSIYYLEDHPLRSSGSFKVPSAIFSARDQLSLGWTQFAGYTERDIDNQQASRGRRQFILVICSLIGLLILWRRGGDWRFAFWLGIWFVGLGLIGSYKYNLFFMPSLTHRLWHEALASPSANLLLNVFQLLDALTVGSIFAFSMFIPCAAIWSRVCWPTNISRWQSSLQRMPILSSTLYNLVLVSKIITVTLIMNLLFWGLLGSLSVFFPQKNLAPALTGLAFVAVTFGIGYGLKIHNGRRLRRLEWTSGLLFALAQPLVMLSAPELPTPLHPASTVVLMITKTLPYALVCALILVFLLLVVRKNFLRLFTLYDVSWVMTASIASTAVVEVANKYFEHISHSKTSVHYGAQIPAAVLALIVLSPPVHRLIERLLLYISLASVTLFPKISISLQRLRTIESAIETALEQLLNPRDPRKIGDIRRALRVCGIREYIFLARKEEQVFVSSVNCSSPAEPDQIAISQMLLQFLAKRNRAIDLEQLAFEWRFFFVQFELERLRQERPARYLIPIKLRESVRGLLFVSNTADQRALAGERVTEGIADLALLTTQLRYQHSSSS